MPFTGKYTVYWPALQLHFAANDSDGVMRSRRRIHCERVKSQIQRKDRVITASANQIRSPHLRTGPLPTVQ